MSQNCLDDVPRYAQYDNMEIFNYSTQSYEQFSKNNEIHAMVIVESESRMITFKDDPKNYDQKFSIISCSTTDNEITYYCIDIKNKRKCEFKFSKDKSLTVTYTCEPIVYRVKQLKIN